MGVLNLSESVKCIEAETFCGDTSLDEVMLPEGVESIGALAFAYSGVTRIYLPDSLKSIAPDALEDCGSVAAWGNPDNYGPVMVCGQRYFLWSPEYSAGGVCFRIPDRHHRHGKKNGPAPASE